MPTILKHELLTEVIKSTTTEKEDGITPEKAITLKSDDLTITIKGAPEDLGKFVRGENTTVEIKQSQTRLGD